VSEEYLTRALKELHISGFASAKILNPIRNIEMSQFLRSFSPCGEGQILFIILLVTPAFELCPTEQSEVWLQSSEWQGRAPQASEDKRN
jgi:hypothetical protein